jgi:hypothetical protein
MAYLKLPTITPTRVRDLACPKRFVIVHIERALPPEIWSRTLAFGNGLHALLQGVYDPAIAASPQERNIERIGRAAFRRLRYPNVMWQEEDLARAVQSAERYLAQDADAAYTVRVETDEDFTWGAREGTPITFRARMDRLVVRPETPSHARFIDYKTGKPGEIDLEGAAVALLVARARHAKRFETMEMSYDFLCSDGLAERVIVRPEDVRHLLPVVRDRALRVLHGGDRTAVRGSQCLFCPLRQDCPEAATVEVTDLDGLLD